jgi:ketosteroid isomerase-like protein
MQNEFEIEEVEEINDRFYRALENSDLDEMSEIWLHEDWVKCVHPGWDLIIGWDEICESWDRIFSNAAGMRVSATEIEIRIEGDFALLSCYENLAVFLDSVSAPVSARTTATNLFQRVGGKWRMIHHHASQTPNAPMVTESDLIQ